MSFIFVAGTSYGQSIYKSSTNDTVAHDRKQITLQTRPVRPKKPKPLHSEISFGARITSNGWGVFMDKAWVKTSYDHYEKFPDQFYNTTVLQVEFSEAFHAKEYSYKNEGLSGIADRLPKSFKYGKINNFYTLRLGYGFRKLIAGKPEWGNVSVHWFGIGGLAVGLLKPYYIDVLSVNGNYTNGSTNSIKYEDDTKSDFLSDYLIVGRSSLLKGLGETKFVPGLHGKTGVHFDYAKKKKGLAAVEFGVNADLYTQSIQIMADQKAYPYNLNIFASIQFGGRW